MKKKTGGGGSDSTKVAPKQVVGGQKRSSNATSYGTKPVYHTSGVKAPAPQKTSTVSASYMMAERAKQNSPLLRQKLAEIEAAKKSAAKKK
jgi:hypothetical protein